MFASHRNLCALSLLLIAPVAAWSQVLYGSIVGNVRDASGAAVPDATITITSQETNQVRSTTTNDEGGYSVPTVQSGTYEVKVTKEGFRPIAEGSVAVTINRSLVSISRCRSAAFPRRSKFPARLRRCKPIAPKCARKLRPKLLPTFRSRDSAIIRRCSLRFRESLRRPRRIQSARILHGRCPGTPTA